MKGNTRAGPTHAAVRHVGVPARYRGMTDRELLAALQYDLGELRPAQRARLAWVLDELRSSE